MTLFTGELPVVDENGEHSEVQILKIHPDVQVIKEFNPDELLANLYKLPPQCPRRVVPMKYGSIKTPDRSDWENYRCPTTWWQTKTAFCVSATCH